MGALVLACVLGLPQAAEALVGRVIDARTGQPIASAEVTIVGLTGSVKTDADGRFSWTPDPKPPFQIIVIMRDGRVGKPVLISRLDPAAVLTVPVEAAVTEAVTVTSGVAPSIDAAPGAAMTLLTGRDLAQRAPTNLTQAVENVPGVNQVSEGQASVPAVRGLARGRTLIMVDGSRVTSERRAGASATFLDPAIADGIDVARGPGSVAYGSDAFGGVISVKTRRPVTTGTEWGGSATFGGGVPDRAAQLSFSRGYGSGGVLVIAHASDVEDYRGPDAKVLNSGYAGAGLLAKIEQTLWGGTLTASLQSDFGRDIERPRNNSNAIRFYYPYDDSQRFNVAFDHADVAGFDAVRVSGFFGTMTQRTDQDRIPTATRARDITRADITASDFMVRATAERAAGRSNLEFGFDLNGRADLNAHDIFIQYDLAGNVASTTDSLSIESARRADTALFAQGDLPLGNRFKAAGGLRVDWVNSVNEGGYFGDTSVSHGAASGFAALTAGPFDFLTLTAQAASGFRDPTLSDRFYRGPSGRGYITGNPDLEPERSLQVDLGAQVAVGRFRLAGYYYHYRIKDLIERYQTAPDVFFFRNRGEAQIQGLEFEAQVDIGSGFALEAAAQISRGLLLDDDTDLDDVAPDTLSFVLRKAFGSRVSTFARVAFFAEDDRPGPTEVAMPGHTNLDVGASWFIAPQLEIRGSVRNLLNQEYYASPDPRWVFAPGVNGFVTAEFRF